MPFESEKQRRYLWANKPEVAREFANKEKGGGRRGNYSKQIRRERANRKG